MAEWPIADACRDSADTDDTDLKVLAPFLGTGATIGGPVVETEGILPGVEGLLPPCSLPIGGETAAECERGAS